MISCYCQTGMQTAEGINYHPDIHPGKRKQGKCFKQDNIDNDDRDGI